MQANAVSTNSQHEDSYEGGYMNSEYSNFNELTEQMNNVNNGGNFNQRQPNNSYSNTYNPGWRNHPNFSWSNQQNQPINKQQGKLPSQLEMNPREHCKAVALRNGRTLVQPDIESTEKTIEKSKDQAEKKEEEAKKDQEEEARKTKKLPESYQPPQPFPQRFQKAKLDKQFGKFLEEILSKKRKLEDYGTVALTEECSAILQNKLPSKLKDPGSFSTPCIIGNKKIDKALCDLGASVRILENIPIKVGKFFIPVDFIILEMEEDV
ncbi:hypothetical protein P3X46_032251 [Hevea brasiliensis]|uniref:Aspartic peptidase DDI1-type domain-containing protein n=1 Tax=Hevea brasiliensis TaxID=3981 RepID=A0ABQ9KCU1_HEVBR|nr:hypothetical protein P3X46_032251 [Hevea brasiliensis]